MHSISYYILYFPELVLDAVSMQRVVKVLFQNMSSIKAEETVTVVEDSITVMEENTEDPLVGVLDILLILLLIGAGIYWLFYKDRRKQADTSQMRSYTIQPTAMPEKTADNSFINKMKSSGRNMVVFYGSQTGTAEEFAGRLAKEGARYKMKGMVADPEECDTEELCNLREIPNHLAVFCLATYGEGDPTDNSQEFYEWLQTGDVDLSGMNFAVFGLGNKTYEHYNAMGTYVDKKLEELGATRVFEVGLGDDDGNLEDDFITWKDKFWPAVCSHFNIEGTGEEVMTRQYKVTIHKEKNNEKFYTGEVARLHSYKKQRPPYDPKNPFLAEVTVNRELHKAGDRSCMHIEFDIADSKIRYNSGDHVAVYPVNDPALVTRIGELLVTDLDTVITLTNVDEDSSKKHPFPCPCSYRTALSHYLDITSNPRTHVLKELSEYASNNEEKDKLQLMCSTTPEGKDLYNRWIIQDNRNIVHVLEDMSSCEIPLDHLCELLPRLQARYYSISSSAKVHPKSISITAVLIQYKTPTGRTNNGVATSWLVHKKPRDGEKALVPIYVRKSQLRLPTRPQTPVILIGPGTGLAPFRGFIQERNFLKVEEGKPVGETVLFFGCRKKSEDFIYEEELKEYVDNGTLKMHVAFSRDQEHKVYVQHILKEQSKEVWRIIGQENGHLYVCGDAKNMARDVHSVITKIVEEEGEMTESQAQAFVKKIESQKKYSADVWS